MRTNMLKRMALALAVVLAGWAATGVAPAAAASDPGPGVVNVNTANAKQLQLLPGIGLKKAQAIIDYRQVQPFQTVDELVKVKGIGNKLLDKFRSRVVLDGATTLKPAPKKKRTRGKK